MKLILNMWAWQIAHNRPAKPVWAIVSTYNGNIFGWSVNKRQAAKQQANYSETKLVRISP